MSFPSQHHWVHFTWIWFFFSVTISVPAGWVLVIGQRGILVLGVNPAREGTIKGNYFQWTLLYDHQDCHTIIVGSFLSVTKYVQSQERNEMQEIPSRNWYVCWWWFTVWPIAALYKHRDLCWVSESRNIQAVIGNENWFLVDSAGKILTE